MKELKDIKQLSGRSHKIIVPELILYRIRHGRDTKRHFHGIGSYRAALNTSVFEYNAHIDDNFII